METRLRRPLFLVLFLSAAIGLAHSAIAQGSFPTGAKRLDNADLAYVLLWGAPVELETLPGGDKQPFRMRLWRTDVERSCGSAGHLICAYRYQLAVSEAGEGGEQAVFDLGEFGTIQSIRWLSKESDDRAVLELSVLNFPVRVFRYQPGFKRIQRTFLLTIGTDSVVIQAKR
jgi:hypothetical protein